MILDTTQGLSNPSPHPCSDEASSSWVLAPCSSRTLDSAQSRKDPGDTVNGKRYSQAVLPDHGGTGTIV